MTKIIFSSRLQDSFCYSNTVKPSRLLHSAPSVQALYGDESFMRIPSIGELVEVSGEVISHGLSGDLASSREALDRLRVLRSRTVATLNSTLQIRTDASAKSRSASELNEKKHETIQFEQNTLQIRAWLRSVIADLSYEELFKSDEGINLYLDVFLPETWDFSRDIIVLNASDAISLIPRLLLRGQLVYVVLEAADSRLSKSLNVDQLKSDHPNLRIVSWDPEDAVESAGIESVMHASVSPTACFLDPFQISGDKRPLNRLLAYISHLSVLVNSAAYWPITFVENWLSQLPDLTAFPSVTSLKNVFKDRAILIAAPGPSLSDSLSDLAECRESYLLLSPVRSLQTLFDANIVPDFAIHVDATDFSAVMPSDNRLCETSLICLEQGDKSVWGAGFKDVFITPVLNTLGSSISVAFHGDSAVAGNGSCVTTLFAHVAVQLGATSITLVGQDLSISGGYYASVEQSLQIDRLSPTRALERATSNLTCEGINGDQLSTKADYKQFILEFEALRDQNTSKAQFVNATTQGARLRGWIHCSLLDDPSVDGKIDGRARFDSSSEKIEFPQLSGRLISLVNSLGEEQVLVAELSKVSTNIVTELQCLLGSNSSDVTKLELLEAELTGLMSSPGSLFKFYSLGCTSSLVGKAGSVVSLQDNLLICLEYYSQLCDLAQQLGEALAAASDRVQTRLN